MPDAVIAPPTDPLPTRASEVGAAPGRWVSLAGRAVLVATDGSDASDAGARVALALAQRLGATVHVISVVDARSAPIPPPLDIGLAMMDTIASDEVHDERAAEVRVQLSAAVGAPVDWPVNVVFGTPAAAIAHEAERMHAALIIVGLQRHGRLERAVRDQTALHVMRLASCPVLGVVPGSVGLPERVLVAMDFGDGSVSAARCARAVMTPDGAITLAYVEMPTGSLPAGGEMIIHELGVAAGFAQVTRQLDRAGAPVDHVVLHHEIARTPADLLLEYADGARCDLIAVGSAHHTRVDRWIMGSVSTDLVHDGRRSVLVVPPATMDD